MHLLQLLQRLYQTSSADTVKAHNNIKNFCKMTKTGVLINV